MKKDQMRASAELIIGFIKAGKITTHCGQKKEGILKISGVFIDHGEVLIQEDNIDESVKEIRINNCNFPGLHFDNIKQRISLSIKNSTIKYFDITKSNFNELSIIGGSIQNANIDQTNASSMSKITLESRIYNSSINFKNISLNRLEIKDFTNQSIIKFSNLMFVNINEKKPTVHINHSDLANMYFLDIDFSVVDTFSIGRSNLSDIKVVNVDWKDDLTNCNQKITLSNHSKPQHSNDGVFRDVYRQLKNAMEKQGDRIQALKFQTKEMNFLLKNLEIKDPNWWVVGFSKISSNHGENWVQASVSLLALSLIFFFPITILLGFSYKFGSPNYEVLSYFVQFLNPLKFDFVSNLVTMTKKESSWALGLFFLWKILYFLWVYQIISAFRKYSRKI